MKNRGEKKKPEDQSQKSDIRLIRFPERKGSKKQKDGNYCRNTRKFGPTAQIIELKIKCYKIWEHQG